MKILMLPALVVLAAASAWGQTAPGEFSGLKSQLEQTLQSALAQTTPLKPRWKLPAPGPRSLVRTALSDRGIPLTAVVSEDRLTLQLWSSGSRVPWGEALTLEGTPIDQVDVTWGADRSAWVAWSGGSQARVATWSGLAWVTVSLPDFTWRGPLGWTTGLRLWGTRILEGRTVIDSAVVEGSTWRLTSRSRGLELPAGARWSVSEAGSRRILAVTGPRGGVYEANPQRNGEWVSLGFPEMLEDLPLVGSRGTDLALLVRPGRSSILWMSASLGDWAQDDVRGLTALSTSAPLLLATAGTGAALQLRQLDAEGWRVPLPLTSLLAVPESTPAVQFLPPPGNSKVGVLVIGTDGWELP